LLKQEFGGCTASLAIHVRHEETAAFAAEAEAHLGPALIEVPVSRQELDTTDDYFGAGQGFHPVHDGSGPQRTWRRNHRSSTSQSPPLIDPKHSQMRRRKEQHTNGNGRNNP
jgi:hypothetical protein